MPPDTGDGPTDLQVEYGDGVATIWFNRPARLNAFRSATFDELHAVLDRLALDGSVTAVILTGRGRAFCAGEDLDEMDAAASAGFTVRETRRQLTGLQDLTRKLLAFAKPVAAAVNGPAVGLGAELPLACGIRVVATDAYFQFPEARRGMLQTNGTFHFLPRVAGAGRAGEWLMTGRRVGAREALAAGLVEAVCPAGELLSAARRALGQANLDAQSKSTRNHAGRTPRGH